MRNAFALLSIVAIGGVTWLSVAPQNASACDCVNPSLGLELLEVTLVESPLTQAEQDVELDAESLRWPVEARIDDNGFWGDETYIDLETPQ